MSRGRRPRRAAAALLALAALVAAPACSGPEKLEFPAGSTMARLQESGRITVGVKIDQPGVGFRNLATGRYEGFDIEIAKMVARRLGIAERNISWRHTPSDDRMSALERGHVDIVVASFSITLNRLKRVGQAGPYYVTGQQLLVRNDDDRIAGPGDLARRKVCAARGSTSLGTLTGTGAVPVSPKTYTECVQRLLGGSVDAVTTDNAILLGYAAEQPDKLKVVGTPFTEERYGIGYPRGDHAFCQFLTETIRRAEQDGSWAAAFDRTLGKAGVPRPDPPAPDPCLSED